MLRVSCGLEAAFQAVCLSWVKGIFPFFSSIVPLLEKCLQNSITPLRGPLWVSKGEGFSPSGAKMYIQGVLGALYQRLKSAENYYKQVSHPSSKTTLLYIYIYIFPDGFGSIDSMIGNVLQKTCDLHFVSSVPVREPECFWTLEAWDKGANCVCLLVWDVIRLISSRYLLCKAKADLYVEILESVTLWKEMNGSPLI